MDLGFLDLGCVSVSDKQGATQGGPDSDSKIGKEEDGMNLTIDETLGECNPHYSKVLSERMAETEAAQKMMQARKAALVEASWCRILLAARIKSKEAEAELLKADKAAAETFEVASSLGVIMYDIPNCSRKPLVETSTINGGRSTSHSVTTSIETAFEVDKEVAAAVEVALLRLGNIPSFSYEESNDQLPKINENPNKDTGENNQELPELSSECESESGSEQQKSRRQSFGNLKKENIVEMILERLQYLKEDELSSLASIVATCGLNAALTENSKLLGPGSAAETFLQRMSNLGAGKPKYFRDGQIRTKKIKTEFPSLDKLLVKNMAKLEKEVQDKNRRNESKEETLEISDRIVDEKAGSDKSKITSETILGLQSILWKHDSKLENDIEEAKESSIGDFEMLKMSSERYKKAIPDLEIQQYPASLKLNKDLSHRSGTATVAVVGRRGIYMAADGRTTEDDGLITSGNDIKIVVISGRLVATLAGIAMQGDALIGYLKPKFLKSDSIQDVCDTCNSYIADWNKAYPKFKFEAIVNIYGYIGDIAYVYSTDTCWIAKLAVGRISGSGSGYGFAKKYILANKLNRLHPEPTDIEYFEIVKGAVAASSLEDPFAGGIVNSAALWKVGMAQFNSRTEHVSKILIRQHMKLNRYMDKFLFVRTVGLSYTSANEWGLKAFVRKQLNICSKMHVFCVQQPRPGGVPWVIITRIMQLKQVNDAQKVVDLKDNLQNGRYKNIKLSRPTKKVIKEISKNLIASDY